MRKRLLAACWFFLTAGSGLIAGVFFFDCSAKPQRQTALFEKEQVVFSVSYATGDFLTTNLKHAIFGEYMRLNPYITIVERNNADVRILDAVGEFPDLMEFRQGQAYFRAGKIGGLPPDIVELFETISVYDGKVYIAPMTKTYPTGIVYSKEIFRRLGIDVNDIKTYSDFLGACEKIKNSGIAPIVLGGADFWHIGFWWGYFWQREISVKDPDWIARRYNNEVRFTNPEVRSVMSGLYELFSRGYIERNWNSTAEIQCAGILVSGQAAMYYIGPFAFQQITEADSKFEFGYFALPDKDGKINIIGGPTDTGWSISTEAQNDPVKAEAIYGFIRYFFSEGVYSNYLSRTNAMSSLKEKYDYPVSEQFREVMLALEKVDNEQLNWHQHYGPNELPPGFRNFSYRLVTQWFLGMHSIDEVLLAMDQEWEAAVIREQ